MCLLRKVIYINIFFHFLRILVTENELRYEKMENFYSQIKQKSFPNTKDVTFKEIQEMGDNCILVDCRSKKERDFSMLPNAVTKEEFLVTTCTC